MRHFDRRRVGGDVAQPRQEFPRPRCHVRPDLEEGNDLPIRGEGSVQRTERVRDAAPLLNRRVTRIPPVDLVPHEAPDHPDPPGHYTFPKVCALKVATAPTTPAEIGNIPGTISHASTAVLNARRRTSLRSGSNSASPACVTPPATTTMSGLMMLISVEIAVPRIRAVSRTTSSATGSFCLAASYTVCAVMLAGSPPASTSSADSSPSSSASRARSAMAGPLAYAS